MTYYLFYITDEGYDKLGEWTVPSLIVQQVPEPIPKPYQLYAITSNKKYASIFRATRDPAQFMERVIEISSQDKKNFETVYMEYMIHKHPLTCEFVRAGIQTSSQIIVPLPNFEYDNIEENWYMILSDIIDEHTFGENKKIFDLIHKSGGRIFRGFVQTALDVLEYNTILFSYGNPSEIPWELGDHFNGLNGYRRLYERTYRKRGILKLCTYGDFI